MPPTRLGNTTTKPVIKNLVLRPETPDEEDDSLYSEKTETSILDVTTPKEKTEQFFDAASTPNNSKKGHGKVRVKAADKCPCGKSDKSSTYVTCAKCKQQWHNKCCNLTGLPGSAVKKLEFWQCPRCYVCPILCHQPASIYAEMTAMREQIGNLLRKHTSVNENFSGEMSALKEQVAELVEVVKVNEVKHSLSPEAAIKTVCKIEPETIVKMEANLTELSQQVSSLQTSIKTSAESSASTGNSTASVNDSRRHPNTESPHFKEVKTPCEPYIAYRADGVSSELKAKLIEHVAESETDFKPIGEGSREVIYYGEHSYTYTGHKHEKCDMPDVIKELMQEITAGLEADGPLNINSCLVTKYRCGTNHIPLHRDDEPVIDPESKIITVSLGANRKMMFENNDKSQSKELLLEDRSVLVTSRYAQDFWKHGIPPEESEDMRVSFTFRNISPYFLNSTLILGDSNSSKINFGTGSGTLGAWVPGKRVKVGHIEALPEATEIGPYRNLIIHTGINSINSSYHRKSNSYLLHVLESKCKEYLSIYPKLRIHVSTILPTRLRSLNHQVDLFNQGILDMCYNLRNAYVIDNSIFGSVLSDEYGRWNVNEQRPFTADVLHLGRKGIRKLAVNFKSAVLNSKGQSRSRFNTSKGSYREALERNRHHDGYQAP